MLLTGNTKIRHLCFADFEFTCGKGISRWKCETLSVGLVICDRSYKIEETFYRTCRPNKNPVLTEECRQLTHFTQEEIDGSSDCNDVMKLVTDIVDKYGINNIFVWGNYDKPALIADIRLHAKQKKNMEYIQRVSAKITDIQERMTKKMELPQAVNIEELGSAFGFVPETGTFHNAKNDALALYTVHRCVYTTDFKNNENFIKVKRERIERIKSQRLAIEKRRRDTAFSMPLSEREREYFCRLSSQGLTAERDDFIFIRAKVVHAINSFPDDLCFCLVVFNNKTNIRVIPESKYDESKNRCALRVKKFAKAQIGEAVLDECETRRKIRIKA